MLTVPTKNLSKLYANKGWASNGHWMLRRDLVEFVHSEEATEPLGDLLNGLIRSELNFSWSPLSGVKFGKAAEQGKMGKEMFPEDAATRPPCVRTGIIIEYRGFEPFDYDLVFAPDGNPVWFDRRYRRIWYRCHLCVAGPEDPAVLRDGDEILGLLMPCDIAWYMAFLGVKSKQLFRCFDNPPADGQKETTP